MKKLDNKGWGFFMFLAFIIVFMLALLMIVYMVNEFEGGLSSKRGKDVTYSQYERYKNYEKKVKKAAESYAKINGYFDIINIGDLEIGNSIKSECHGYAQLDSTGKSYIPYLKCGNYESEGFSPSFVQ